MLGTSIKVVDFLGTLTITTTIKDKLIKSFMANKEII